MDFSLNAHDLDAIMSHFDEAVELTSPVTAQVSAYLQRGLEAYRELYFDLNDLLTGLNTLVLYYVNQKGTHTAEFMELAAIGKGQAGVCTLQRLAKDS